jgi:hypothetical protein
VRSHCKAEIHAVLAKCGVQVPMTDLFGVAGTDLLDRLQLPAPYAARIGSLRRLVGLLDFEIDVFAGLARRRLATNPGYTAVQAIVGDPSVLTVVAVAPLPGKEMRVLVKWSGGETAGAVRPVGGLGDQVTVDAPHRCTRTAAATSASLAWPGLAWPGLAWPPTIAPILTDIGTFVPAGQKGGCHG